MKRKPYSRRKRTTTKSVLRLPDLEHAKAAVLNSLTSPDAQRGYRHAIDEFVDCYCSEARLAFNRIVVLRYRSHLESGQLSPGTINLRLGAVRRLPYEAADCGLLSADLAAGHSSSQRGEEVGRRAPRVRSSFSYRISRCDCWASSFSKSARSGICLICFSSNPSSRKKESAGGLKVVALRRPCSHCPCD